MNPPGPRAQRRPHDPPQMAQEGLKMSPDSFRMALKFIKHPMEKPSKTLWNIRFFRNSFYVEGIAAILLGSVTCKLAEDGFKMATRWLMMELSWPPDGPKFASRWLQAGPILPLGPHLRSKKPYKYSFSGGLGGILMQILGPSWGGRSCGDSYT